MTNKHPAANARIVTGAGAAIALISMVGGFQIAAATEQSQNDLVANQEAAAEPSAVTSKGQAVIYLDPSLAPTPTPAPATNTTTSTPDAPAAPAPPAPAPEPAAPAPPADGTTGGSGG